MKPSLLSTLAHDSSQKRDKRAFISPHLLSLSCILSMILALGCSSKKDEDGTNGGNNGNGSTGDGDGDSDSGSGGDGDSGDGDSTSSTGGSGSGTNRANSACGLSLRENDPTAPPAGGGIEEFEGCVSETREAEAVPADIFIMLDQSISMGDHNVSSEPNAPTRWEALTDSLKQFIESPTSAGLRIGIQYFGLSTSAGLSCNPDDYAVPDVAIGELPGNEAALIESIDDHFPSNLTPSVPALEGALRYAKEWATDHPERPTVVVFATDGYPTDCEQRSISDLEALASAYANPTDGSARVSTFVVGVGQVSNLERVARAAGTGDAYFVADCPTAADDLLAALKRVSSSPALCEFEIPEPPEGELLDYNQVNMVFTPNSAGGQPEVVRRVGGAAGCGSLGGWYYDDEDEPTTVLVCPASCSNFGNGTVRLVVGCETISIQ